MTSAVYIHSAIDRSLCDCRYVCNHDGSGSQRIYGAGPTSVADTMVEQTYKYDSGAKEFKELPTMVRHRRPRARIHATQTPTPTHSRIHAIVPRAWHWRRREESLSADCVWLCGAAT